MKIAVPFEDGQVFQHFGRSAQFKFYEAENGQLLRTEVIPTNGQGHGALAGFLVQHGADVVLCGGIGTGAQVALMQAGIQLFGGLSGAADAAVADYLAGKLVFDPDIHCTHHDHEEGHSCGSHAYPVKKFYRDAVNCYLGHEICGYEGRYLGNCDVKITAECRKQQGRKIIHRRLCYVARIACGKGMLKGKLLHKYYSSFKEIACFHVRRMESIGKGEFLKGSAHKVDVLRA